MSNFIQRKLIRSKKIRLKGTERLLIIKADRIGDAVWCVNFVRILKSNFPKLEISVLANDYNRFVFDENKDLFAEILSIDEKPPYYLIKDFKKIFTIIGDFFNVFNNNYGFWSKLKKNKYDYIINLSGRKYFMVSKYLGKSMGGGLGVFNFFYTYPIIGHDEIGATQHIISHRLESFQNINPRFENKIFEIKVKRVLVFVGGKQPNALDIGYWQRIKKSFIDLGCDVKLLADNNDKSADFVLSKNNEGFMVGKLNLKDFVKDFDLFVGVDGGVLHYASMYVRCVSICLTSNFRCVYPYGNSIKTIKDYGNIQLQSIDNKHFLISNNLRCQGCFQIGCQLKKCQKSLDKKIEILIKEVFNSLNVEQKFK